MKNALKYIAAAIAAAAVWPAAAQNPIVQTCYTTDPAPMVHDGRLYVYTGHDEDGADFFWMQEWRVYSTEDMVNWTDHGSPMSLDTFKWSESGAWASQCVERDGKFYWYVCCVDKATHDMAIGVAVADSPTGPFKDARGSALITNDMTTQYTSIPWDDIDPTVFIDDDGQAYLFWGNTQCYYAKLKENMIELDGPIMPINLPRYTEAPWIHKHGEWYYLSFASEFPEKLCYAMSKNINGPWEYKGILNELAGNSNTNHQAIIEFKGKTYFIYHNGSINPHGCGFRRAVCADLLEYNPDGTIKRIQMTTEGVFK